MNFSNQDKSHSLLSKYFISDEYDDDDNEDRTKNDSERLEIDFGDNRTTIQTPITYHQRNQLTTSNSCDFYQEQFKSQSSNAQTKLTAWLDDSIVSFGSNSSPRRSQYRLTFEIIRAKIISSEETNNETISGRRVSPFSETRYVLYTILIKRLPGLETHPAVIDRRYSDFHAFFTILSRRYKNLMCGISLPRKQLLGNFTPEVIARRSEQFQQILVHCYSNPELRSSQEFAEFLFYPELKESSRMLKSILLEDAAAIFENVFFILEKIGTFPEQCIHTLACLIGCLNAVDNHNEAEKYAQYAFDVLDQLQSNSSSDIFGRREKFTDIVQASEVVLPLILLALRHNWIIGERRQKLEMIRDSVCSARSLSKSIDAHPTLLECLLRKDFNPILQ